MIVQTLTWSLLKRLARSHRHIIVLFLLSSVPKHANTRSELGIHYNVFDKTCHSQNQTRFCVGMSRAAKARMSREKPYWCKIFHQLKNICNPQHFLKGSRSGNIPHPTWTDRFTDKNEHFSAIARQWPSSVAHFSLFSIACIDTSGQNTQISVIMDINPR